jgi:hypothetical protein
VFFDPADIVGGNMRSRDGVPLFPWAWTILDFILEAFKPRRQGKVGQRSSPP